MKKVLFALVATAFLFSVTLPAQAASDEQDVAKITCKELTSSGQENISLMIMWIDGYMSGKSDNTVMSDEWITKLGEHLGTYCKQNPGNTIMQAMESIKE